MAQQPLPQRGQLDADPTLFTMMAAVNAAGFDAGIDSPYNHPLRQSVRNEIALKKLAVVDAIREFLREHRLEDDNAALRQYISFALLVEPPPSFEFRLTRNQLPPDVAALEGFAPLLRRFWQDAGIPEIWTRSQPLIEQALARYQGAATRAVQEASGYLRAPIGEAPAGKRFAIIICLQGIPNQIHFYPFLDDYSLVLTPSVEPQYEEIRRAYLHFLLDPLATRYQEELNTKSPLLDYALGAPFLSEQFKKDFLLLATRSLIRAIEARFAPPAARQAMVDQAMGEGFTLTAHFTEQLPAYEKQDQSMRLYFPELVSSIDFRREERRMAHFEFTTNRPEKIIQPPPPPPLSLGELALEQAERLYTAKDYAQAREAYRSAIGLAAGKPLQARAYYGLARIAALERDPELAWQLFEMTLTLEPPPVERAWTLVYLGRLSDAAGEREQALARYRAALSTEGASEAAKVAAKQGLEKAIGPGQ